MLGSLDDAAIDALLRSQFVGRIGCHADGRTYVIPVSYVYEDGYVYAHTSEGRKIEMMRDNPEVCFEIDEVSGPMHWDSVVADATFEELAAEDAQHAFGLLIERLVPLMSMSDGPAGGGDPEREAPADPTAMDLASARPVVFRLRLGERTGRFQRR
jgi:nitroimidazol reductase NimA-like FMN-containing flavoprotein (pyridoxamine 5'-phosphate oxidase superfamily)